MRILLIINYLWRGGGTETYVVTLARRLHAAGHRVGVYTTGGPWVSSLQRSGVAVHKGPITGSAIAKCVQQYQYQALHVHDNPGFSVLGASELQGIPSVMTVHGLYSGRRAVLQAASFASYVIAVSPVIYNYALNIGIPASKVILIRNGIATSHFRPKNSRLRSTLNISSARFVIGYAGRFTFTKGDLGVRLYRQLYRYAKKNPNVRVLIAGRDSNKLTRTRSRVRVLGHVSNMRDFYNACDLVIGTGRVAMEAMSAGVPTIAIGESSFVGLIDENSLLTALKNNFGDHGPILSWSSEQLYKDIDTVRKNASGYKQKALKLRSKVIRKCSSTKMVTKIQKVYRNLV